MGTLDKVQNEHKSLETTTHKLLDEDLPWKESAQKKRKSEEKAAIKLKSKK